MNITEFSWTREPQDYKIESDRVEVKEMVMTRLRMAEGLNLSEYRGRFGDSAYRLLLRQAERYIRSGALYHPVSETLALTEEGVMISDEVMASLF